jgi:excisionase family DNA binding protein
MRRVTQSGQADLYLSTVQAAEALGVGVSTVKRWVDAGVLPAHRTAGGHRKLLRAELMALARREGLPRGDRTVPHAPRPRGEAAGLATLAASLAEALLGGRGPEASAIIRRVYAAGVPVEVLADAVVAPAMASVGHEWQVGRINVWQEHRGTELCAAALYDLKADLEARAERDRPTAVGGAPEGDLYVLPTLLAQLVLLDAGWEAVNLGPNTPLPSVARALHEIRPRLLWLSVSHVPDPAVLTAAYRKLYHAAEGQAVPVVIGGSALHESLRSTLPCTTYGDGLHQLAASARALQPRPKPPRRGRPPGAG